MSDTYIFSTWAGGPYYNMAFDEWMLARAVASPGSVHLRLYTWQEPTITFGYSQRKDTALDFTRVQDTPVVRRITGGRALFHDLSELTYSVAVNTDAEPGNSLGRTVSRSTRMIAGLVAEFLARAGIESNYVKQSSPEEKGQAFFHKAPCFESFSRHELTSQGKKIVASAQKRLDCAFLQHGAIKWRGLAHHPALSIPGMAAEGHLQPVAKKELVRMTTLLGDIFARKLDTPFRNPVLSERELSELAELSRKVEKKALVRRGIIAQNGNAESL